MPRKSSGQSRSFWNGIRTARSASAEPQFFRREMGWKSFLAKVLYYLGLLSMARSVAEVYEVRFDRAKWWPQLRKGPQPKFLILCYHRVGSGGVPLYSELAPSLFAAQMRFLKRNYRVLSLDDVCRELKAPTSLKPGVAITFDDGYRDLYRHAFPSLRRYQIPATVYLIAESMETGQVAWYDRVFLALQLWPAGKLEIELDTLRTFELTSPQSRFRATLEIIASLRGMPNSERKKCCTELAFRLELPKAELENRILSWEQVRLMQTAGISFGSHTITHPVVSRLAPSELSQELLESKRMLEAGLGRPVRHFAFPFGHAEDFCSEATRMLAQSDYVSAVTTIPGVNVPGVDPFAMRRVQVGEEHDLSSFAYLVNQSFLVAKAERPESILNSSPMKTMDTATGRSYVPEDSRRA
jgi:peptidoglycan/xylan/chitin deacetylase (PgdA/CDA1 family)